MWKAHLSTQLTALWLTDYFSHSAEARRGDAWAPRRQSESATAHGRLAARRHRVRDREGASGLSLPLFFALLIASLLLFICFVCLLFCPSSVFPSFSSSSLSSRGYPYLFIIPFLFLFLLFFLLLILWSLPPSQSGPSSSSFLLLLPHFYSSFSLVPFFPCLPPPHFFNDNPLLLLCSATRQSRTCARTWATCRASMSAASCTRFWAAPRPTCRWHMQGPTWSTSGRRCRHTARWLIMSSWVVLAANVLVTFRPFLR